MKTASDTNRAEYVTMTSVTRLGYFLKFLATIFFSKHSPFVTFLGYFEKHY